MKITLDVITDLLPVYLADEASNDTRALVDEFLKENPNYAKLIAEPGIQLIQPAINITKETEMLTLNATRTLLRKRSLFMGFAIFFTCFAFAFTFDHNGLHWLWTESPIKALINLVLGEWTNNSSLSGIVNLAFGVYFWIRYFQTNKNLKGSDL
jgi:hypothetical protein